MKKLIVVLIALLVLPSVTLAGKPIKVDLKAMVEQETADRQADDAALQSNITAEETARQDADANLQSQIDIINSTKVSVGQQCGSGEVLVGFDTQGALICQDITTICGGCCQTTSYNILDYLMIIPGEIKVYSGAWDGIMDYRVEVSHNSTETDVLDGKSRTTYLIDNYNINGPYLNFVYTSYEYEHNGQWVLWKEVDESDTVRTLNFILAYTNMEIGEVVSQNGVKSELLEASKRVFPLLNVSTPLEYLKFKFTVGDEGFTPGSSGIRNPTVVTNGANTVMIFKSSGSYTA